jgi:hypothetical protein
MSWLGVVRRHLDPALTGHRGRLKFRRTLGTAKTFTRYIVFGRTIGIICLGFLFGHYSLGQPFFD